MLTPHGSLRLMQEMSAWSVKTAGRAPSRYCGNARVYGHTTTVRHDVSTPPHSFILRSCLSEYHMWSTAPPLLESICASDHDEMADSPRRFAQAIFCLRKMWGCEGLRSYNDAMHIMSTPPPPVSFLLRLRLSEYYM